MGQANPRYGKQNVGLAPASFANLSSVMGVLPTRNTGIPCDLFLGFLLVAFTFGRATELVAQQTAAERQAASVTAYEELLRNQVDAAEKVCLSNTSSQEDISFLVTWRTKLTALISGTTTIEKKTEVLRGAARSLPDNTQLIENDKIRNCMNKELQPILSAVINYLPTETNTLWPEPIDFRFNFIRGPSKNSNTYTEKVRLELQTRTGPKSGRLAPEDPQATGYYKMYVGYPQPGEIDSGTIVAERKPEARLTSRQPIVTDVCFQRPSSMPAARTTDYDLFDCTEGTACGASPRTTGWLQSCSPKPKAQTAWIAPLFVDIAYAATQQQTDAAMSDGPYWSVPSAAALAEGNIEGVGYTVFTLETDVFRHSEINSVEVGVRVNGIPVREDGLPPELRPIANDPQNSFLYRFALQTLNFQGAEGCERIDIGLRPVFADGRKGQSHTTALSYVALRDVRPRVQPLGDAELKWNAAYITPEREWRHIAELHSYIYRVGDVDMQNSALGRSEADKRWLDSQALTYDGQKVVGVIRPPRTLKPNGTAAYGLAAGLIQETGQVRFTFSEEEARKLAAFMIAQRHRSANAARIIHSESYIFQAVSGAHTVHGVCGN